MTELRVQLVDVDTSDDPWYQDHPEDRAVTYGATARLKIVSSAMGVVDLYDCYGEWQYRTTWSPFSGFADGAGFCPELNTVLFTAFHAVAMRNIEQRSKRRKRNKRKS